MCGRCQRIADGLEDVRQDPELHPDYEDFVARAERSFEAWLDRIGGG